MKQNIEDLAQIMVDAQPNDRYSFAIKSAGAVPRVFRVQKVCLTANGDPGFLLVVADDEGFSERVYNPFRYLDPDGAIRPAAMRRAVVHILWDYLNETGGEAAEEALDVFRYRHLEAIEKY